MYTRFEFQSHGVDHAQYFTGGSTAYTPWTESFVGVGETEYDAYNDAIEMFAQSVDHSPTNMALMDRMQEQLDKFVAIAPFAEVYTVCDISYPDCESPNDPDSPDGCDEECELHFYVVLCVA